MVAGLGLLMIAVTVLPIDRMWLNLIARPWNDPKGDILIVLGADVLPDMIGISSYLRAVYAVRVWREGGFREIVVSGGRAPSGSMISEQIQSFLLSQGVPASAVRIESRSKDTHENALFTAELLAAEPGRKVLLTSDYHILRARLAFQKAGLKVEPRPIPDAAKRIETWRYRWDVFLDLTTEMVKLGYYGCRGWI
jgi:uncharacterized SAM-binding protein YcdF (DUF218 family)